MHIIKTKKVFKAVEEVVRDYYTCDNCGDVIDDEYGEFFDFTFSLNIGQRYPGYASGEKQEMDLCKDCAEECVELLEKNGYKIRKEAYQV